VDEDYAAIVLAGGTGERLGRIDKAELDVAGQRLLDRALAAVAAADPIVVVGPERDLPAGLLQTRERPAGAGPVAAVAAGLAAVDLRSTATPSVVVVLACDMPLFDRPAVAALVAGLAGSDADAAMHVADGRRQFLAAAYRREALSAAVATIGDPAGASMRMVVDRLTITEIAAHPEVTLDCDTWQDVELTRKILEDR
jgi:molybdopterin molybdotransferase